MGVTVMGYIRRTLNTQDIPWVMAWLQGELDGMHVGVSLCILNGGIFPLHDIPAEVKCILEQEHEIETGPLYTLMLTMRHTWLRPELGDTAGDLIDDYSDVDNLLSGDLIDDYSDWSTQCLVMDRVM